MEKYTSEMVKELLERIIAIATAANITALDARGKLSEETVKQLLSDLRNARSTALLILNRMRGWEYATFDVIMMEEVKRNIENHIREDEET